MSRRLRMTVAVTVCALSVGVVMTGCRSKEPGRFYDDKNDFSIRFPDGWEVTKGVGGAAVAALTPLAGKSDPFRENVNVVVEKLPAEMSLSEYDKMSVANMEILATDFRVISKADATIGGREASCLEFKHCMGKFDLHVLSYTLVNKRRAYIITCTASPETFSAFKPKFEKVAASFRLE